MARHKRRYAGLVSVPFFNGISDVLGRSVKFQDALIGSLIGVGATALGKYAYNKAVVASAVAAQTPAGATSGLTDILTNGYVKAAVPAISGALAGAGVYYAMGKSSKAVGYAAGSVAAGVAVSAFDMLKSNVDGLADLVALPYNGLLVRDQYNGLLVRDPAPALHGYADAPGLSGLASLSVNNDEDSEDRVLV